ncbi:MAG: hypothetical protein ACFFDC_01445 [Promethearchaeota archaeon]
MENRFVLERDTIDRRSFKKLVKNIISINLLVSIIVYFFLITFDPAVWLNSFFSPITIFVVLSCYWGPVLLVIGSFTYITRMSNIKRIPITSSLFDVITLPTIQYGPIKIIFPIEKELMEENEVFPKKYIKRNHSCDSK